MKTATQLLAVMSALLRAGELASETATVAADFSLVKDAHDLLTQASNYLGDEDGVRRPIGMATYVDTSGDWTVPEIVALCDDGSTWIMSMNPVGSAYGRSWRSLAAIPGTPAHVARERYNAAYRAANSHAEGDVDVTQSE